MSDECPVCLLPCSHPVELPCNHTFCFLCIKGVAYSAQRKCPMCRTPFPREILKNPKVINHEEIARIASEGDGYIWYYEGSNGWWQYDHRTNQEIEAAFSCNRSSCEVLIAGFIYKVDFEEMVQFRVHGPGRKRRIKRDLVSASKKGVAGLLLNPSQDEKNSDTSDSEEEESGEAAGRVARALTLTALVNLYEERIHSIRNDMEQLSLRLSRLGIHTSSFVSDVAPVNGSTPTQES
ncbi:E3 ubiquitin-protein ligase RNF146-like isoform X2 [Artemia franciscana]|uniref:E3 ubiquitin-protein ligase n=2 Tax=Artemia franciscana TaxID=6661 RepID=A0AA88LAB0_ARTSF|nr:hypothetical protein QYM36_003276 [Artemia franciscana]KAK2723027.1 hypothetical protein QYM36_003276 [Artemia franciscana]